MAIGFWPFRHFRRRPFADFVKIAILAASIVLARGSVSHICGSRRWRGSNIRSSIALATVGMMMMVSANDLISLYVSLELQSLALYVLAAFNRDNERSSEAGLKYFVLGALSSGLLLYGCSLVYGFSGTTHFEGIIDALQGQAPAIGIIIGIVFIARGPCLQNLGGAVPYVDARCL